MKYLFIFLIAFITAVLVFLFPHTMINPGELIEGHQKLNNNCSACHKPFGGIDNNKCISCHKLSDIGKNKLSKDINSTQFKIQFHESLLNQECNSCHSDHKGIDANIGNSSFKHELLALNLKDNCNSCHRKPLDKLHNQITPNCSSCHNTTSWNKNVAFSHDMIVGADKNNCVICHQAPQDTFHKLVKDNCNQCHTATKWTPSTFDHSRYFVFDGNHTAECKTCHNLNDYKKYTCFGCHEHSESNIRGEHLEEGITDYKNCATCHKSGNEHEGRMSGTEGGQGKNEGEGENERDND